MFRLLVVLALLSCVYGLPRSKHHVVEKHGQKIIGGEETTIEKHPYQVALYAKKNQKFLCGGSIISDHWILTTARCVNGLEFILIRAGSSNIYVDGTTYSTTNYTIHPQYNLNVAVVNVPKGIKLNKTTMKAVELASSNTSVAVGTKTIISGWGSYMNQGQKSVNLRSVQVPIVSQSTCRKAYGAGEITDDMLCAGGIEESGFCKGDEGGPQVLESGVQIGVISFGDQCDRFENPGVYTKVASIRSWIKEVTGV